MEIKFKKVSLNLNIAFYGGLVVGTILAKFIYPLDMGLGEVLFKLIRHWGFGW